MKTFFVRALLLGCIGLSVSFCGQSPDKPSDLAAAGAETDAVAPSTANPANMEEAMQQAQKQLDQIQGDNKNVTPVNFRKLKELLPETLLNLPRTRHTGESAGAMGIKVSTAEASYRDGQKRLNIKIMDAGGLGMSTLSMAPWTSLEVDKEDDNGYERTSNWGSFKAYEKCRTSNQFCSFKLYSKQGIIAEIEGYGMDVAALKQVAETLNLERIAGMRE